MQGWRNAEHRELPCPPGTFLQLIEWFQGRRHCSEEAFLWAESQLQQEAMGSSSRSQTLPCVGSGRCQLLHRIQLQVIPCQQPAKREPGLSTVCCSGSAPPLPGCAGGPTLLCSPAQPPTHRSHHQNWGRSGSSQQTPTYYTKGHGFLWLILVVGRRLTCMILEISNLGDCMIPQGRKSTGTGKQNQARERAGWTPEELGSRSVLWRTCSVSEGWGRKVKAKRKKGNLPLLQWSTASKISQHLQERLISRTTDHLEFTLKVRMYCYLKIPLSNIFISSPVCNPTALQSKYV